MADIALVLRAEGDGDLVLAGQDLARDDGLESAVLISLFVDARATPEQLHPDDDPRDLRGWWGDIHPSVEGDATGSLLWRLAREKQTPETLARARQYATQALAWLIDDRVASAVHVRTDYPAPGVLRIEVAIDRPHAQRERFRFDTEWAAQAARR